MPIPAYMETRSRISVAIRPVAWRRTSPHPLAPIRARDVEGRQRGVGAGGAARWSRSRSGAGPGRGGEQSGGRGRVEDRRGSCRWDGQLVDGLPGVQLAGGRLPGALLSLRCPASSLLSPDGCISPISCSASPSLRGGGCHAASAPGEAGAGRPAAAKTAMP
jgi:hypothetical protein